MDLHIQNVTAKMGENRGAGRRTMHKKSIWPRFLGALGWMFLLLTVAAAVWRIFIFPWASNWGSTKEERSKSLSGDEFGAPSTPQRTCGLTIYAPADEVWKWLVQIGQDRGGFYSYSFLENLVGGGIHNTNKIRPEWQELKVGDTIRLGRDESVIKLEVLAIDPGRFLVLPYWGAFVLEGAPDGRTCRLLIRSRGEGRPLLRFALSIVLDPIHFLMQRRMMLGIKELAEAKAAAERPLIPTTSDYVWFFSILGSGFLILVMLFAWRQPGRLLTAVGLTALLTFVLYRFPPFPAFGIALAVLTLGILLLRIRSSHSPVPQPNSDGSTFGKGQ
jgi:hypothetical protein